MLGIGLASGRFADSDDPEGFEDGERVVELYYSLAICPTISLCPDVQHVADPGGESGADDAMIVGVRARILIE